MYGELNFNPVLFGDTVKYILIPFASIIIILAILMYVIDKIRKEPRSINPKENL